jgi:glycosyltransferase involved in cell wall biosynthesis
MLTIAERFPNHRVTISGSAWASLDFVRHLREEVTKRGLRNVTVLEDPTEDDVVSLLTTHSVFVFPAPWEHFGIVTVEAIQAGLLPLVHNSGGQREIVPIEALRFENEMDLVEKAAVLLATSPSDWREMLKTLQSHVARGSAKNYCREMLLPLCRDLGLTHLLSQVQTE